VRWRRILLAVTYVTLAAVSAFALYVSGSLDCYESCRDDLSNPPWRYDRSSWQWDAMRWLGLSSGIASVAFVVTVFRGARLASAIALGAALATMTAGGLVLYAADYMDTVVVVLVIAASVGTGWGLMHTRGGDSGRASPSGSH
jgi:hypothetical protein